MDAEIFDRIIVGAIAEEIAARDFYAKVALRDEGPWRDCRFQPPVPGRERTRNTLETFRYNPLARVEFERPADFLVAEHQEEPQLSFAMSPKEAFQLAMKKEQQAAEAYRDWRQTAGTPRCATFIWNSPKWNAVTSACWKSCS